MSYVIKNVKGSTDVIYFGNEKDAKGKTIKTTKDFETEFRNRFATIEEANRAIQEQIKKHVVFDYEGVTLSELIELHSSQTTVFKLWYNNWLTKKKLDEIINLPKEIEVSVRQLLDSRGNRMLKKSEDEVRKEMEKLQKRLAKMQAALEAMKGGE